MSNFVADLQILRGMQLLKLLMLLYLSGFLLCYLLETFKRLYDYLRPTSTEWQNYETIGLYFDYQLGTYTSFKKERDIKIILRLCLFALPRKEDVAYCSWAGVCHFIWFNLLEKIILLVKLPSSVIIAKRRLKFEDLSREEVFQLENIVRKQLGLDPLFWNRSKDCQIDDDPYTLIVKVDSDETSYLKLNRINKKFEFHYRFDLIKRVTTYQYRLSPDCENSFEIKLSQDYSDHAAEERTYHVYNEVVLSKGIDDYKEGQETKWHPTNLSDKINQFILERG